jgi:hypothetical protein
MAVHSENAIAPQSGVGADAWGSFDGAGARAIINSSMNIESITKNGAGNYSIVFITPMPASDYAVTTGHLARGVSKTTTGFDLQTFNFDGGAASFSDIQFAVHSSSTVTPTYTWTRDGTTLKPANDGDDVILGSNPSASVDNIGSRVTSDGRLIARRDGGNVFQGYTKGSSAFTSEIGADGSATFAGGSGRVSASGSFISSVGLYLKDADSNNSVELNAADGSAVFKGSLVSGNGATVKDPSTGTTVGWFGVDTGTYNRLLVVCRGKDGTGSMNGPYVNKGGNTWTTGSDRRMKESLTTLENGLEKVSSIKPYIGKYKGDAANHAFLIAQELQQVLPEAVDVPEEESEMMGVRYTEVIPLLVSALHDTKARIEALEAEVQALKGGNN